MYIFIDIGGSGIKFANYSQAIKDIITIRDIENYQQFIFSPRADFLTTFSDHVSDLGYIMIHCSRTLIISYIRGQQTSRRLFGFGKHRIQLTAVRMSRQSCHICA